MATLWKPEVQVAGAYPPRTHAPKTRLGELIWRAYRYVPVQLGDELLDALASVAIFESSLSLVHIHGPNARYPGLEEDYGVVSRKVITNVGASSVVNAFRNTFELELFNYHALGTGSGAEAATDTALAIELTTQYSTDNTRPTGTQSAPGSNQYQTVATITVDAAASITEHGIFSQAAAPGGTLWDRSLFAALALNSGDSIVATYIATITAGG